jgi:hypothetical protein
MIFSASPGKPDWMVLAIRQATCLPLLSFFAHFPYSIFGGLAKNSHI